MGLTKFEITSKDEAHEAIIALCDYYNRRHKAPAAVCIMADLLVLLYGPIEGREALDVTIEALSKWREERVTYETT